jgi:hypothetical protein
VLDRDGGGAGYLSDEGDDPLSDGPHLLPGLRGQIHPAVPGPEAIHGALECLKDTREAALEWGDPVAAGQAGCEQGCHNAGSEPGRNAREP